MMMCRNVVLASCFLVAVFSVVNAKPTNAPQNASVMCTLPEVRGHCRALLPRWRYDPATEKCHEFKFGGCDGNGNNFMSEKNCMTVCAGV